MKKIVNYENNNTFCVLIPIYYEYEKEPAWRKVFTGSKEECEKQFSLFPDFLHATYEENKKNRANKKAEYLLLLSINKTKKAESIKKQYHF